MTDLIDARSRSTLSDDETWPWPSTSPDTGGWLSGREFRPVGAGAIGSRRFPTVSDQVASRQRAADLIEPLLGLGNNWDGYGASAPSVTALEVASRFLRGLPEALCTPDVSASVTGGVMIEWDAFDIDIDIVIEIDHRGSANVYVRRGEVEEEGPLALHQGATAEALATLSLGTR